MTSPLVRWTWSSFGDHSYSEVLTDYRPTDVESVAEMMSGRYLLASRLVDTDGVSPFSVPVDHQGWHDELHGFSWLRHFRGVRDEGEQKFARTLIVDWIGRYGGFEGRVWAPGLTAVRVLNWLRHYSLLTGDANAEQKRVVDQVIAAQVQSLRTRAGLLRDPIEQLLVAAALLGAALSDGSETELVHARRVALEDRIGAQFDADGMHLSRQPGLQIMLMTELVTLRQALAKRQGTDSGTIGGWLDKMHCVLASLTLGTGDLGYFNGSGQQPSDLVYALQAQGAGQRLTCGTVGGYGILANGAARLVADGGMVPPPVLAQQAHAGALSFEFSHGHELLVGNCGPAPEELMDNAILFRRGLAHSSPTINSQSAALVASKGIHAGCLMGDRPAKPVEYDADDVTLRLQSDGFARRFGYKLERWLTLISDGDTLVGQDRVHAVRNQTAGDVLTLRFHLGPGVKVTQEASEDIIGLELPSGARWSFLWEGATANLDESVRQSASVGFHRTDQIVLEAPLRDGLEVAWILTKQG